MAGAYMPSKIYHLLPDDLDRDDVSNVQDLFMKFKEDSKQCPDGGTAMGCYGDKDARKKAEDMCSPFKSKFFRCDDVVSFAHYTACMYIYWLFISVQSAFCFILKMW
jgi:hypothetical protein